MPRTAELHQRAGSTFYRSRECWSRAKRRVKARWLESNARVNQNVHLYLKAQSCFPPDAQNSGVTPASRVNFLSLARVLKPCETASEGEMTWIKRARESKRAPLIKGTKLLPAWCPEQRSYTNEQGQLFIARASAEAVRNGEWRRDDSNQTRAWIKTCTSLKGARDSNAHVTETEG